MSGLKVHIINSFISICGKGAYMIFRLLGWNFVSLSGKIIGNVIYLSNGRKREIIRRELELLLGKRLNADQARESARLSFDNYYKRQVETVFFGSLEKQTLEKMIQPEGLEHIDQALSNGKGVIMLLSHFGSFLLPLPFLGYRGYKVNQITGKQIHGSLLSERIWEWRRKKAEKLPVQFKQVDKFLRPVYQALKNNEIVAIAFDGRDSTHWAVVDFLGRKAQFSTGPFELARRTGAVIIPTFIIRRDNDTQRIVFERPFELSKEKGIEKALLADTQNFTDIFSGYVAEYPCHFGMVLYKSRIMLKSGNKNALFVDN
jgi:KDO2-lipid IV(A) lauroyltransferase